MGNATSNLPRKILKTFLLGLPAIFISTLLVTAVVFGWAEPTASPPGGNMPVFINAGSFGQSMVGGLILNTGGAATGLIVDRGNVGIGTISPTARLEVAGQIKITGGAPGLNKVLTSDAAGLASWENLPGLGGGGGDYWTQSGNYLYPSNNNLNVGIGTASPKSELDITTTGANNPGIALTQNSADVDADILFYEARTLSSLLRFHNGGGLEFRDRQPEDVSRLFIGASGRVGIGTASPKSELDITTTGANNPGIALTQNSAGVDADILFYEAGTLSSLLRFHDGGGLEFRDRQPENVSRLFINASGNVGIGTASIDPNYRLTISEGGIKAENNSNQPAGYFSNAGGGRAIQTGTGAILFGNLAGTGTRMVVANASGLLSTQDIYWTQVGNYLSTNNANWRVGIGTASPKSELDITTTGANNPGIALTQNSAGVDADILFYEGGTLSSLLRFHDGGGLEFRDRQPEDVSRLFINASGKVVIGTGRPDPNHSLTVHGSLRSQGAYFEGTISTPEGKLSPPCNGAWSGIVDMAGNTMGYFWMCSQ